MAELGLSTDLVQVSPVRKTGTAVVTVDHSGKASYVIERPAAFDDYHLNEEILGRLKALRPDWLYLGTLAQREANNEANFEILVEQLDGIRCFYDMNLREDHWDLALVRRLSSMASVIKLNETEAKTLFQLTHPDKTYSLEQFCREWATTYKVETICITLGGDGCSIYSDDELSLFPGYAVKVADTVGAGDAFAVSFLHGYSRDRPISQRASFANALGALVSSRVGATPAWTIEECLEVIAKNSSQSSPSR
jgi:fructokinase